ncbi:Lrp/AsnC family transcriptional regulator [Marivita sp. S2033]|uniref:Lrp/AsnC family transcriptional regulator n=1 Tax=Marivita sp. S2033 TaxID=3373187 RepID=UPI0039826A53
MTLDETDRRILNALQDGFPITSHPFEQAGREFGLSEDELLTRLGAMKEARIITRFGPFFDAAAMGGAFCLCAMAIPPESFDAVVEQVNAHPEVAHNYERTHHLNMWFVLATETEDEIGTVAAKIEEETGHPVLCFPKLQEFFVRFRVAA